MDVVNRLEKRFGMRFREEWLYDMETCAIWSTASRDTRVPRRPSPWPAPAPASVPSPATDAPIPAAHYDVAQFPECVALHQRWPAAAAGLENPFFRTNQRV